MCAAKLAHRVVELFGPLEVADVTGPRDDNELCVGNRLLELVCDPERGTRVLFSPDQENRRGDPGEQIALVGLGHQEQLRLERPGADRGGDVLEKGDELRGWLSGEQPRKPRVERRGGRGEHFVKAFDSGMDFFLRQGPLPSRVRVGEDEGPYEVRVVAVKLERDSSAPGEARDVSRAKRERIDKPREAVRVIRKTEIRGQIGGVAGPGFIPGDDRELAGQSSELRLPDAAVIAGAMNEHERRSLASALIRDIKARDPDDVHGSKRTSVRTYGRREIPNAR